MLNKIKLLKQVDIRNQKIVKLLKQKKQTVIMMISIKIV